MSISLYNKFLSLSVFLAVIHLLLLRSNATVQAYSLQGKRALVTGASGGIGKAIALALGQAGCRVVVHYHLRESGAMQTLKELGGVDGNGIRTVQADFRNVSTIKEMMNVLQDEELDILVNNAGVVTKLALEDDDDDLSAWHDTLAVNLHAPRLLSQWFYNKVRKTGTGGVILNVGSIHSEKSNEYVGAYAASKAALDAMTRSMAIEWAKDNVRVNVIAPGVVPVERTADYFSVQQNTKSWADHVPLERLGTVQEIAQAALAMITNDWVTGAVWQIDGGMMARNNMPPRPRPEKVCV